MVCWLLLIILLVVSPNPRDVPGLPGNWAGGQAATPILSNMWSEAFFSRALYGDIVSLYT